MSEASQFFDGVPVEVDAASIDRELSRLWKPVTQGGKTQRRETESGEPGTESGAVTRACLSNLVVLLPDDRARERATRVIGELSEFYPSRVIFLSVDASARQGVEASITAVCHLPPGAGVPVCCEQITLRTAPDQLSLFPGTVSSLLVPDVPAVLLLSFAGDGASEERYARLTGQLEPVLDQVVLDSRFVGPTPFQSLGAGVRPPAAREASMIGSCRRDDLAWYALTDWRLFLADAFDDVLMRPILAGARQVVVTTGAPDARVGGAAVRGPAEAILLATWLGSRLGYGLVSGSRTQERWEALLRRPDDGAELQLAVELCAAGASAGVQSVSIDASRSGRPACLVFERDVEGRHLLVSGSTEQACVLPRGTALDPLAESRLLGKVLDSQEPSRSAWWGARDLAAHWVASC